MNSHIVVLVLDNVRSLYNVGAIFRLADGLGIDQIMLCGITPEPPRAEIHKTALGAEAHVKWRYFGSTADCVSTLKTNLYQIVALEITNESEPLQTFKPHFPLALIVGHERDGISDKLLRDVDSRVHIPMLGHANSLNVATAVAIACWHIKNIH